MQITIHIHGIQYEYAIALISAMTAGLAMAPFMIIIIKSVAISMSDTKSVAQALLEGLKSFLRPIQLARSLEFRCVLIVAILTYAMSNTSHLLFDSVQFINPSMVKLLASFIVNTTGSMIKEKVIAQNVRKSPSKPLPLPTILLFLIRDIISMASAFSIPQLVASRFYIVFNLRYETALSIAQFFSPMFVQLINTYVHLLALDLYNRQGVSFTKRMHKVQKMYFSCFFVRAIGFTIAFGIAGNVNRQMKHFMGQFLSQL